MSTACGRPQEGGVKLMWTYVDTGRGLKNPDFPVNVKNRWPLSITLRPYNLGQHITTHARKHARKHIHRWTDVFVYRSVASSFFPNSRNSASLNSFDSDSFSASLWLNFHLDSQLSNCYNNYILKDLRFQIKHHFNFSNLSFIAMPILPCFDCTNFPAGQNVPFPVCKKQERLV